MTALNLKADKVPENRTGKKNMAIKKLYKFKQIDSNTTNALIEGYAWYPKPASLNDPFDCGLSLSMMTGHDNCWGVLSLAEDFTNMIMWSHYSNSHRGICIEYTDYTNEELDSGPLKANLNKPAVELSDLPIVRNATPVKYLSTEELSEWLHDLPQSHEDINSEPRKYNSVPLTPERYRQGFIVRGMKSLFLKHHDWSYESEYRIVINEGDCRVPIPGVITTIFLGMNTTESQCQIVFRIGQAIGAKVLKMERVQYEYRLAPRELKESEMNCPKPEFASAINSYLKRLEH